MQVQNSTGDIFFGNTVVNPASGFSNQRGLGYDNSTGNLEAASTSGTAMTIGRNESSDGQILQLRKESNIKHSFGSTTSYLLGNVGIGTTSPSAKLDISGMGSGGVGIRIKDAQNVSGNYYYGFMFDGTDVRGTTQSNIFYAGGSVNAGTTIATWASLRIDTPYLNSGASVTNNYGIYQSSALQKNYFAGNVGIGTTPHSTFKLDVLGTATDWTARIKNYTNDGYGLAVDCGGANSSTTYALAVYSAAGGGLFVRNDDKVGINVTAPLANLHIHGDGDLIRATSTNTGQGGAQMDLLHHTTSPANNDIHGLINFGGYYSGTNQSYGSSIKSVWTDVGNQHGQLQFFTRDGSYHSERARIDMHGIASKVKHASNSGADVLNTTFTEDFTTFQGHGKKYLGMFVIRDGSRYLDVAINSTANNVMYYIYVIGYLYNRGTYVGVTSGYTYQNNSIINHNSGDILELGTSKSIVSYRGTNSTAGNYTGYLCFRFDSGGNGYSEGQLQVYISSHSLSWQKFADVHAVVQNDTTNNYFAQ